MSQSAGAATDWRRTAVDAYLASVLAGEAEGARGAFAEAIAENADPKLDAASFHEILFAFANRPDVIDAIGLVRLAFDRLPAIASGLRPDRRRVMARLHKQIASDCTAAGWASLAAHHTACACRLEPMRLLDADTWRILRRRGSDRHDVRSAALRAEVAHLFETFTVRDVDTWLVGTLAVSLHAGYFVKRHDDIDLVVDVEDQFWRAHAVLTRELDYQDESTCDWKSLSGRVARLNVLASPRGHRIDLACLPYWADGWDSIAVPQCPLRPRAIVEVDGIGVQTPDLRDLRDTYYWFLLQNEATNKGPKRQSDKNAIVAIDRLIGRNGRDR
jgi:hypothetical protein